MPEQSSIESEINSAQSEGERLRERAFSGKPRFGYPDLAGSVETRDRLLSTLMGFRSGMEAAQQGITQGNPIAAAIAGLAGGLSGPTPEDIAARRATQSAQFQMQQIELTPIQNISPTIVKEYPELIDTPLAAIQKISPILERASMQKQQMFLLAMKNKLDTERLLKLMKSRFVYSQEAKKSKKTLKDKLEQLQRGELDISDFSK